MLFIDILSYLFVLFFASSVCPVSVRFFFLLPDVKIADRDMYNVTDIETDRWTEREGERERERLYALVTAVTTNKTAYINYGTACRQRE